MGNAAGVVAPNRVESMTVNVNIAPTVNIAAGSSGSGEGMMIASAAGGAAVGAYLGGPAGALLGAALGAAGSLRQLQTRRSQASMAVEAGEPHQRLIGQHQWLSEAELQAIGSSDASSEETCCKVCLRSQVTTCLQPCGHAALCAPCLLQLSRASAPSVLPLCPICRETVRGCQRVFL